MLVIKNLDIKDQTLPKEMKIFKIFMKMMIIIIIYNKIKIKFNNKNYKKKIIIIITTTIII